MHTLSHSPITYTILSRYNRIKAFPDIIYIKIEIFFSKEIKFKIFKYIKLNIKNV